jgi:hypothetical protein
VAGAAREEGQCARSINLRMSRRATHNM